MQTWPENEPSPAIGHQVRNLNLQPGRHSTSITLPKRRWVTKLESQRNDRKTPLHLRNNFKRPLWQQRHHPTIFKQTPATELPWPTTWETFNINRATKTRKTKTWKKHLRFIFFRGRDGFKPKNERALNPKALQQLMAKPSSPNSFQRATNPFLKTTHGAQPSPEFLILHHTS